MKIAVPIKQVPDTEAKVSVAADGRSIDDSNVTLVVNPYDEYALEEGLRIKEARGSGEVIVVTVGPDKASQALRTCLAMGADRGIHVKEPSAESMDPVVIAKALAAALREVEPDLILTGKYAVGTDNQAVGVMLAELLGLPHVAVVTRLELHEGTLTAERQIEGAVEIQEASLPCVVTAHKGLNEPRYASLKGIMAAKRKPIEEKTFDALGLDAEAVKPRVTWERIELPPPKPPGKVISADEDPEAASRELVRLLHEEAKVI